MTLDVWFWLFMALWLLGGFYLDYAPTPPPAFRVGRHLLLFLVLLILGLRVFGSFVK